MKKLINLYNEIMENPKAEKIEYNISSNYVENLDAVFGIKEFIANFYDVNKEDFNMHYQSKSLVLEDDNDGIDIRYMIIGNSGSRDFSDKIGEHGEGFKIGALTLVRLGYKVLIETVGYTIAFGIENSAHLNATVMFAKYIKNNRKKGTVLFTECTKQSFEKAQKMFLHLSEYTAITKNIIDIEGKQKNIYLNGLSHTSKRAFFSYNIFEKNLVSNRDRNFISSAVLKEQISNIYQDLTDKQTISLIMNRFLEDALNFDKYLESMIFSDIHLTEEQKESYVNAIESNFYFIQKGSKASVEGEGKKVIEVDGKLFNFLSYIGANVIFDDRISNKNKNIISLFEFSPEELPISSEIETNLLRSLKSYGEADGNTVTFSRSNYSSYGWGATHIVSIQNIEDYIITCKQRTKSTSSFNLNFEHIFNNLLLLSCYDFSIYIEKNGVRYTLIKEIINKKINILVKKANAKNSIEKIVIQKEVFFEENTKEEDNTFIYLGCLRAEPIESLYSYRIQGQYRKLFDKISKIVSTFLSKKSKTFFEKYLNHLSRNEHIYEYRIDINPSEKNKKTFKRLFDKMFPNHVLQYKNEDETYDEIAKNSYGFEILKISSAHTKQILHKNFEIPNSYDVFLEKQSENIHVIPNSKELEEAIQLFENTYHTSVPVYLTPTLVNKKESLHQDGNIYISDNVSKIPIYLTTLIAYEYTNMTLELPKVSYEMQDHLSENVLK